MSDSYVPGPFDVRAPSFNTLGPSIQPTPGLSTTVVDGPGMRGVSTAQQLHGVSARQFATSFDQYRLDCGFQEVVPVSTVVVSCSDAVAAAVANFAVEHAYRPAPAPGFTASELVGAGWDPCALGILGGDVDAAQRCAATALAAYARVLTDPVRAAQVAQFLGLPSTGPNHHVAWVRIVGRILFDMSGAGREGELFTSHSVMCECSSVYQVRPGGGVTTFFGVEARTCLYAWAAQEAAATAAAARLGLCDGVEPSADQWRTLLDAVADDVWVGQSESGLYVDTVARMCGIPTGVAFASARRAVEAGTIGLDQAVVVMPHPPFYTEPPTDVVSRGRLADGRTVQVFGPANRFQRNVCQVAIVDDVGDPTVLAELELAYAPQFGYDVSDLAALELLLTELGVTVLP